MPTTSLRPAAAARPAPLPPIPRRPARGRPALRRPAAASADPGAAGGASAAAAPTTADAPAPVAAVPGSQFVTRPPHQTTLATSFTLGGVALHSGAYTYARVRPAAAGDGRYFVLVPPGTNAARYVPNLNAGTPDAGPLGSDDAPATARLYAAYLRSLDAGGGDVEAAGGPGGFEAWRVSPAGVAAAAAPAATSYSSPAAPFHLPTPAPTERRERVLAREEGTRLGGVIDARADAAAPTAGGTRLALTSPAGDACVACVDDLLSALEGMGVTNARIEVEPGPVIGTVPVDEADVDADGAPLALGVPAPDPARVELPATDGSALPWAVHIQRVGVVPAGEAGALPPAADDPAAPPPPRVAASAPRVAAPLSLTAPSGDGYAAFVPGPSPPALSAGVAADGAPVVGRQWAAWAAAPPASGDHYRWALAAARGWVPSSDALLAARLDHGLYKAGSLGTLLVGAGAEWADPRRERYPGDEPARNAASRALAALALLAAPGGSGLPDGHVIVFNADADLLLRLVKEMGAQATYGEA